MASRPRPYLHARTGWGGCTVRLSFDQPLWLVALALVPLVAWVGLRTGAVASVRPRQLRTAAWLRAAAVALLVLALGGPRWESAGREVDVAFLVDSSDSVGTARAAALDWIDAALEGMPDGDRASLALFGREPRLEYSLREDPSRLPPAAVVDGSASDLSRALRLAQGVLGSEHRRRAVLFTDGRQNQGDALRTAEQLRAAGVSVDVVPLASGQAADVLVESVTAPNRVREGEAFDVVAILRNSGATAADVVVVTTRDTTGRAGGGVEEVDRRTVTAEPGATEVVVPQVAESDGTVRYEVRLASGASTIAANDVGRAAVQIDGPASVLVYEGETGAGDDLERALTGTGLPVTRLSSEATAFPSLDRLLEYESVILVDVPATALGVAGMTALDAFVRDAGRGLVAVGGDDSFGMGGYDDTPLEDLLPVFARVKDPKRRPNVAEALVVDVSGSMAACHCRGEGFAGGPGGQEGGVNKTDITKEAVARAVQALTAQDTVGVLAFNSSTEWVLPLQQMPSQAAVDAALAKLRPDGETVVAQAVREAIASLKDVNARLRHIVLFTDGFSEDPQMVQVAREAAEAGITLSVVGTGEGAGTVLQRMAAEGGGRYYPGRDLFSIPDIIVSEVQFAARPIINEGEFFPVVTGVAAPTEGLTSTPPLKGYLATTAKPTSRQLLQIGPERDPLMAQWQAGLGTAIAWTSDATARWSSSWLSWEGYQEFWSDTVRSTFPGDPDPRYSLAATQGAGGLQITVESADVLPTDAEGIATVTFPDGTRHEIALQRTSLTTFGGTLPLGAEGVYAVAARLTRGDTDLFRDAVTAIRSYSPEYAVDAEDTTLLTRLADVGGGRFDPEPASAFVRDGLEPGSSSRGLWPLLALLALLLLPAEIGLRRLRLERDDWGRARAWAGAKLRREHRDEVAERRESTSGLFAAKARAGGEQVAPPPPSPDATDDAGSPRVEPPPSPAPTAPRAAPADAPEGPAEAPATPAEPPTSAEDTGSGASSLLEARRRAREQRDS